VLPIEMQEGILQPRRDVGIEAVGFGCEVAPFGEGRRTSMWFLLCADLRLDRWSAVG
jgi:hypothetical protein